MGKGCNLQNPPPRGYATANIAQFASTDVLKRRGSRQSPPFEFAPAENLSSFQLMLQSQKFS